MKSMLFVLCLVPALALAAHPAPAPNLSKPVIRNQPMHQPPVHAPWTKPPVIRN